jgi:hypothetical protein
VLSVDAFVAFLAVAASLLALWLVMRFPSAGPRGFGLALAHVCVALVVASFATSGASVVLQSGITDAPYVATFGLVLPALVYVFVAAAWMISVLQGALGMHRR